MVFSPATTRLLSQDEAENWAGIAGWTIAQPPRPVRPSDDEEALARTPLPMAPFRGAWRSLKVGRVSHQICGTFGRPLRSPRQSGRGSRPAKMPAACWAVSESPGSNEAAAEVNESVQVLEKPSAYAAQVPREVQARPASRDVVSKPPARPPSREVPMKAQARPLSQASTRSQLSSRPPLSARMSSSPDSGEVLLDSLLPEAEQQAWTPLATPRPSSCDAISRRPEGKPPRWKKRTPREPARPSMYAKSVTSSEAKALMEEMTSPQKPRSPASVRTRRRIATQAVQDLQKVVQEQAKQEFQRLYETASEIHGAHESFQQSSAKRNSLRPAPRPQPRQGTVANGIKLDAARWINLDHTELLDGGTVSCQPICQWPPQWTLNDDRSAERELAEWRAATR
eukprot:TRINITY_DN78653_c0_g1_i1.p1 TRINITY_DN78653_c0_g1~~TRINITY_DN78653_c0_g1_i1.p1  ORF type:complete len:397 (-),score=56.23 TRINITY_DN78653_c0_g1_i1:15-1205(-)